MPLSKGRLSRSVSLHEQIAGRVREDIETGVLRHGQALPSTRELAEEWGVSVFTINEAMKLLQRDGSVISKSRAGRVINAPALTAAPSPRTCVDAETFAADVVLEGPPEAEFYLGIASRIPVKGSAGGALMRDEHGQVLFVTPRYKPFLDIPGGIAGVNESPKAACQREVAEEIGLDLLLGSLLVVDWVPQSGVWRDSHQFIFDAGILTSSQVAALRTYDDELDGLKFLPLEAAAAHIHPSLHRRLLLAIEASQTARTIYAEFGRPL